MHWILRILTAIATHKTDASAHHAKTTAAGDITSGRFPVGRLPAMTDEKIWKGTGGNVEEIDVPSAGGAGHITILPPNYSAIGQGTWGLVVNATYYLAAFFETSTHNDGDNISYQVYLEAGTYTLQMMGLEKANTPITDIYLDAEEVASFDWYSAVTTINVVKSQAGIVVATTGLYTLKVDIDGKHGSSTDHALIFNYIALWRTS